VKGNKVTLSAHNTGDRRLRISALTLRDASGHKISLGTGLAGYALGQSTKSWTVSGRGFAAQGSASVSGQSDGGPIQAVASIRR
jgi:fimbrial chaperone protein